MAAKIYVRQTAVFHADSVEELVKVREAAKQLVVDGGGGVEHITDVDELLDAAGDLTFVQVMEYLVLREAL